MEEGIYDKVVLRMSQMVDRAKAKIGIEFKNKRPFDKVPVPPKQQIMNYMEYVEHPEIEQEFLNQGIDPMAIQKYHDDMQSLMGRYNKNGR